MHTLAIELHPEQHQNFGEVTITVRVTTIRDGTLGISLSVNDKVFGEWTDSGARSLTLTSEYKVGVCGRGGNSRYMLSMPETPLCAKQLSDTEVTVTVRT